MLRLHRMGSTPWGTFGHLRLPDGTVFPTVEPHWEHNAKGVSCIPAGIYDMAQRQSAIVERSSDGKFMRGWEIQGVPNRDLIMIHPANWARELQGCIAPGRAHSIINGVPGVSASRAAFADLMHRLNQQATWQIEIRWTTPE